MVKLGIVVGHSIKDGGAKLNLPEEILSQFGFDSELCEEYDYNLSVAEAVEKCARLYQVEAKVFLRNGSTIDGAHDAAEEWGAQVVLELHFNSVSDSSVMGAEVLTTSEYESKNGFAAECAERMANLFGGKNRGVKHAETRGHENVYRSVPTYLLEPFFGSNSLQAEAGLRNQIAYAKLILILVHKYFS